MRNNQLKDILGKIAVSGDRLTDFKPNPGGQVKFCKAIEKGKKEIILAGGNDTGKTYLGTIATAWWTVPEKDIRGSNTGYAICPHRRIKIPPEGIFTWISTASDKKQQTTVQPVLDLVLGSYIKKSKMEGGSYIWIETEIGRIDFMTQEMGVKKYAGDKLHLVWLDEPHSRGIYRESQARLYKYNGTHINTLTPIVDEDTPTTLKDIMWMKDKIITPYESDPSSLPMVEVVYVGIDENPFHDASQIRERNLGMSEQERVAREYGRFILTLKGMKFDRDMLETIRGYILLRPEICTPQYGRLEYDPQENRKENQIQFWDNGMREGFPERPEPEDGWIIKIWEHPIKNQLGIQPDYYMGGDVSGNKKGDYSCIYVKRGDTHATVACLHGYIDELELARQVWLLGYYYSDRDDLPALVCIEGGSNNPGGVVLQNLITGFKSNFIEIMPYEWTRIYHRPTISDLKNGMHIPSDEAGYYTSSGSRDFLVGNMASYIAEAYKKLDLEKYLIMKDIGFYDEAMNFIQNKDGKYTAASGMNDDRLFASALCDMAIKQGLFRQQYELPVPEEQDDSKFSVRDGVIYINNIKPKKEKQRAWI